MDKQEALDKQALYQAEYQRLHALACEWKKTQPPTYNPHSLAGNPYQAEIDVCTERIHYYQEIIAYYVRSGQ
jgi:hypothetical protein